VSKLTLLPVETLRTGGWNAYNPSRTMTSAQTATNSHRHLYIGGKFEPQAGTGSISVLSASTEEVIGSVPEGTAQHARHSIAVGARLRLPNAQNGCASWLLLSRNAPN
jgi:hypothetical protein